MEWISKSVKKTEEIAKEILPLLKAGDIVALEGDLGAGKTTFVKALAKAMGEDEQIVTSPTFTIVNEYSFKTPVYHLDLYRIKSPDELFNIGIENYLFSDGICLVEWAERAPELFDSVKRLSITKLGKNKRKFIYSEGKNE